MPLYEYYCAPCSDQFELLRPLSQVNSPAVCPSGHTTNNLVLSLSAPFTKSNQSSLTTELPMQMIDGAGCCSTAGGDDCACC